MPLANPAEIPALVTACRAALVSSVPIEVDDEYFYASLQLRVIDSVCSLGVGSVRGLVLPAVRPV